MKYFSSAFLLAIASIALTACSKDKEKAQVVSERYLHKYGYDVSPEEWATKEFPGQVITTLRNGVTVSSSYDEGLLHGTTSYTFPHSQTRETLELYEHGTMIKKVIYSIRGTPLREELYLTPTHIKTTTWYKSGTPKSLEVYKEGLLMNAEYYNTKNEPEFKVVNGCGQRVTLDKHDRLSIKETVEDGVITVRETFHENQVPHTYVELKNEKPHGVKKEYASTGEPLYIENYVDGLLHGTETYYQNGYRYLEMSFNFGRKEGTERHYVDGETIVEETHWISNKKHGPSVVYYDGMSKTTWFYNNEKVSKDKFRALCKREQDIAIMNDRSSSGYFFD